MQEIRELAKKHIPGVFGGKSDEFIDAFFRRKFETRSIFYIYDERAWKIVGFMDWSWIQGKEDIEKQRNGEETDGEVLFIHNLVSTLPTLIWEFYKRLPKHRYICWIHDGEFHAPKGMPKEVR